MAEINRYSPFSGRILTEEGGTINIADLIGGSDTGEKENINRFSPRTGRMIKEDGTIVNIADALKELIESGGVTPDQIQQAVNDYLIQNPVQVDTDQTLTQSGQAADAKATGDAIKKIENQSFEQAIERYYALRRTGKVYQTKIWKFTVNPTSDGEKLLDNAGLVFAPSTDTIGGQDDYLNGQHPLFEWVHVNYIRDADGSPRPISIEGMDGYQTTGTVDVGAMQMSFWWRWDTSNQEYDLVTVSDTPHPELGLKPWVECVKADGTVLPWCIGSSYVSGIASDGLLRSQPGLKPERKQSHNNMVVNYQKKGAGYWGAGACRNLFQIIFNVIKGATKNSQALYRGCTNYSYQYDAAVERPEKDTYFPVTKAQAETLIVGSCVSVGYAGNNAGTLNKDRNLGTMHSYADSAKILKIEDLDENNSAVYLDIDEGFDTIPVTAAETLSTPITLSTMHWLAGATDVVLGHHDGSPKSNTSSKTPYRVQGREYAAGGYIIASDTVLEFQNDYSKNVYVAQKGLQHSSSEAEIRSTYTLIGNIYAAENGSDWWIGDIFADERTGGWFPSVKGSSDVQGFGDRCYAGGTSISGFREYLQGGSLGSSSNAGSAFVYCWYGFGDAYWSCLACD